MRRQAAGPGKAYVSATLMLSKGLGSSSKCSLCPSDPFGLCLMPGKESFGPLGGRGGWREHDATVCSVYLVLIGWC
jgi:hypothetical protein